MHGQEETVEMITCAISRRSALDGNSRLMAERSVKILALKIGFGRGSLRVFRL
jgi:hypothetical protein